MKSNAGFSLVEILVAMVLLVSVGAMTMYSFASVAKTAQPGLGPAYHFGRGVMEKMFEFVRQDNWATAGLPLSTSTAPQPGTVGVFTPQGSTKTLNGKTYTLNYAINNNSGVAQDTNGDGREDFRRVRVSVTW